MLPRICIVTDRKLVNKNFFDRIRILIEKGFTFIQLREKDLPARKLYEIAKKIMEIGKDKLKLVINDRVDLAYSLNAFGVHLGVNSLPSYLVKKNFRNLIVGISVHCLEELKDQKDYDYVFFGNVFETSCKPGLKGKGIEYLKDVVKETKKPVYAIGGINSKNVKQVLEQGVYGVAIRSLAFLGDFEELDEINKIIGDFYGKGNE